MVPGTRLPLLIFQQAKLHLHRQQCRHYLSAAYRCEEMWKKRLDHPLLKDLKPGDYFYDMDQKYKREGKVTAIDVDLFVNSITDSQSSSTPGEIEEIVHRLRRSRESIRTLPSTHHATLRHLLQAGRTDTILKFLSDPMNYGIFPDHYTANILMDAYLEQKNFTAGARVASCLMLQEDFGPPLTQALALASAYSYATSDNNPPWEDYTEKPEEPVEEVKIRVKYLRNPYFDDHFDLTEPQHLVGKTLAWLSPLVGGSVGVSCEVLGWAMYGKWKELEDAIQRVKEASHPVAKSVVQRVNQIIESCKEEEGGESHEGLLSAIVELENASGKVVEMDLAGEIEAIVRRTVTHTQEQEIQAQVDVFKSWEKRREEEFENQLAEYRKQKLMAEIEEKKRDLTKKEQVIFFFENQEKLEMLAPKNWIFKKKTTFKFPKKKAKKVDEGYIPPTVR